MNGINPRGMTLLDVVKRYPEQVVKSIKHHAKECSSKNTVPKEKYNEAVSLINHIDAMVESPDTPHTKKIKCIKAMILEWSKKD